MEIRRGDVVIASLDPTKGSEQQGTRPCLVVQNDLGNEHSTTTIIVPFTTAGGDSYPVDVFVGEDEGPLREDSVALCNQVRTISIEHRISESIGAIDGSRLAEVDTALEYSLGLQPV